MYCCLSFSRREGMVGKILWLGQLAAQGMKRYCGLGSLKTTPENLAKSVQKNKKRQTNKQTKKKQTKKNKKKKNNNNNNNNIIMNLKTHTHLLHDH